LKISLQKRLENLERIVAEKMGGGPGRTLVFHGAVNMTKTDFEKSYAAWKEANRVSERDLIIRIVDTRAEPDGENCRDMIMPRPGDVGQAKVTRPDAEPSDDELEAAVADLEREIWKGKQ